MNYQTFQPHPDLDALIKCYWTLEVPAEEKPPKQRIVPDGCIEMIFILGNDVKRYTSDDEFIIQPRAMVLGQITEPFFVQPTGYVNSFAIRFYPYGFASFAATAIKNLANKETPISLLFGEEPASQLEHKIISAANTKDRIEIAEEFFLHKLKDATTIDSIVKATVDTIIQTEGSESINSLAKNDLSKRRQLERKFINQVGLSPKQLGKVIRLQTALKMVLQQEYESLTKIAYDSKYYDQAHFIKDFKEFTGANPKDFLAHQELALSALFYTED
jgi:AraC-like DNA-binding protein